jgi:nucleoside-diphosphate-sugar epimerase
VVINNLVGWALTTGEVRLRSDGSPWRPLVHVQDLSADACAALEAPREVAHDPAFNVGKDQDSLQIRDVAWLVEQRAADSRVTFAEGATADTSHHRVDQVKITKMLPEFCPGRTVSAGVEELVEGYTKLGLTSCISA